MKFFVPRVLNALCLALLFLIGCDWLFRTSGLTPMILGASAQWPSWESFLEPWQQWVVTSSFILLPILTAASWLIATRDKSIKTVTSSGDSIRLTPAAIERIVCREVKANVPEVLRIGAVARQGKKGPAVVVSIATSDKVPVPEVDADVRRETVRVLKHLLGVSDPSEVKIVVYDVQGNSSRKKDHDKDREPRRKSGNEGHSRGEASSSPAKVSPPKAPSSPKALPAVPSPAISSVDEPKSFAAEPAKAIPPTTKP